MVGIDKWNLTKIEEYKFRDCISLYLYEVPYYII